MIIGITGVMGSGKSTLAKKLAVLLNDCEIIPFAKPLKDLAFSMGWDGKKDAKGRKLLQLLGTECGRNLISQDIWVDKWKQYVADSTSKYIIVDDVRFRNEAYVILDSGGYLIKVDGRKNGEKYSVYSQFYDMLKRNIGLVHASEIPLSDSLNNLTVNNYFDFSIVDFHKIIKDVEYG